MNVKSQVHRLFRPRTVFPSAKTKNTRTAWSNVPVYILSVYKTAVDTALTNRASALRVTWDFEIPAEESPARAKHFDDDGKLVDGDLIMLLQLGDDGWSDEDWRALYDERAGISEFDGGLPRSEAEPLAFECCLVEWLNRSFERSPPGSCLACGGADRAHDVLMPHGVEATGHVWLHSRCWPAWHAGQKADAVKALKAMGIQYRSEEV
jgi:hypothetical protein